ncbi:L,D-transpeptidase family protein [Bradyrhizobium sp.]|uniref:L,D-transpeptidase family protein n=1 Tax=Bradyrhizobium sp. TaxID=376 RepID=UPI001EBBC368|nr:L,D-transpeptidase family protein [Bradyrhizobium sp.]MBV9978426.1 L,D-transpeptidase family protein [Bradyrhizobium sp.]
MTRFSITNGRYSCLAALSAAVLAGATSRAQAALYYWTEGEPAHYWPAPRYPHPHKPPHQHTQKGDKPAREATKPQGPLIVAISINEQKLKLYDANGFFAESPVSTGMQGHPTPMGVFSVIQKQKYHRSNIYSDAPMPYMQRITWSGVAMHAGVLPGYPASHGCIRMPMAFAVKMWNWTRMGARVVVTPGEITPARFSHPLLPAFKIAPQPALPAEAETNDPAGAKADRGAPAAKAAPAEASPELRATIGHQDDAQSVTNALPATLRTETHTADASGETPATKIMSDASPVATSAEGDENAAKTGHQSDPASSSRVAETPAKPDDNGSAAAQPIPGKSADKPTPAATGADKANDAKKDQSRLIEPKRDAPKRGQIAVFISRKDSKLYVRQNFEPLFDAPVTIASSDRPLGTHVFTAEIDKTDPNALHWSVVSLPGRSAKRVDDEERQLHRHKGATSDARSVAMADNPAEALDRISIPADTMARIADALTNGGSIIVSDQGINQGETGEGTDFIVSLR